MHVNLCCNVPHCNLGLLKIQMQLQYSLGLVAVIVVKVKILEKEQYIEKYFSPTVCLLSLPA